MSTQLTHKCDGCSVEVVETDDADLYSPRLPGIGELVRGIGVAGSGSLGGSATDDWGHFRAMTIGDMGGYPKTFDLCPACVKRVAALLEIDLKGEAPPPPPGFMPPPPGYLPLGGTMRARQPRGLRSVPPLSPLFDSMQPAPGVDMSTGTFTCPNCGSVRDTQSPNPICIVCGHQNGPR